MDEKPLKWYTIEDCPLCNSTGKIFVKPWGTIDEFDKWGINKTLDCPLCDGKGELKIYKRKT